MPTLGDIIERNARFRPDREALVFEGRRWTFRDYAARCRRAASALARLGLRHQDRVAILAMNSPEYLEIYGAVEMAGFVLCPLNFRLAPPELAWILEDTAPRILIFEAQYASVIEGLRPRLSGTLVYVCLGGPAPDWALPYEALMEAAGEAALPFRARPQDMLCIIYTSGTTGRPKGVIHSNQADARLGEIMAGELGLTGDGKALAIAPLFHVGARSMQLGQHWRGGTVVLQRGFDPGAVLSIIAAERITAAHLVPTMLQAILEHPDLARHDLSSLKTLLYAAAPMPVPLLEKAVAIFGPILVNGYGQTEANAATFLQPYQHTPDKLASVGQPHPQSEIRIIAEDGTDLPPGEVGEIVIRSPTAMTGYWNNSVATQATLADGWVKSGDMGRLDGEGYLFLVDRKKDMIISGGENIYCREVEDAIAAFPAVEDNAVIGVPDDFWGQAVKAVIVRRPGSSATEAEIIDHCRTLIARYKVPKSVVFVDELPRLPSGKVNKPALRTRFGG